MQRRIFSILLVICMMISMMPVTALAEEVAEDGHHDCQPYKAETAHTDHGDQHEDEGQNTGNTTCIVFASYYTTIVAIFYIDFCHWISRCT